MSSKVNGFGKNCSNQTQLIVVASFCTLGKAEAVWKGERYAEHCRRTQCFW